MDLVAFAVVSLNQIPHESPGNYTNGMIKGERQVCKLSEGRSERGTTITRIYSWSEVGWEREQKFVSRQPRHARLQFIIRIEHASWRRSACCMVLPMGSRS
jgi:hypothetical protein